MKDIQLTREYYLNFLIKIMNERFYHNDYIDLNKQKLEVLNRHLNLDDFIDFDFKKHMFKFKNRGYVNKFKLKNIRLINNIDLNNKNDLNNLTSYIEMYFNNIIYKLTSNEVLICSGITLETNSTNEIVKESFDSFNTDILIYSHLEQIKKAYLKALDDLLSVLYQIDFSNDNPEINTPWDISIKDNDLNKKDIEILNKELSEYDHL